MAAYAALASLMNNIELMMRHPRLSISVDKKHIETLLGKADELLQFLNNNNHGGVVNKETEDLERQITSAAHLAEDVIETHMVDQILLSSAGEQKEKIQDPETQIASAAHLAEDVIESHIVDQIQTGSKKARLESPLDLQQRIEAMDSIVKKAAVVKGKWGVREEQPTDSGGNDKEKAAEKQPHTTGEASSSSWVGLKEAVDQVMDKLTLNQPERHIISIVGMGGTGKTTLAQNVYQNPCIKHHFDFRAWATVSQKHDVREILSQLLSKPSLESVDELGEQLHKTLWGRRYLIVLDDIWCVEAWDEVRRFFPDDKNGSRVVLTTRLYNLVTESGSTCFPMKLLDEQKSWALFCTKAFKQENCPNPELENVGKEIARLCKGLPLSLVVIGGLLLKSPKTVGFWEDVAKNIKSIPNSKEKQVSLDVLSLSYNHLPPHLKSCFIYMGIFKEDSEIRVSNIINLWVAEGFVRPNEAKNLEETGNDYLEDMISRNLVLVDKPRGIGKIGSCRIHDLLRDLCLKLAEQQEFFHVMAHSFTPSTDRRLVYENLEQIGSPLARSIMIRSNRSQSVKYKLLRVLDDNSYESPEELFVNVNLRYLAYDHLFNRQLTWKLPTSVSLLWNLQTLIFKTILDSMTLIVAPIEIWKMRQLRHVKCCKMYLPNPPSSNEQDYLENLQTLTSAINLRLSEEVCKIIPNIKKLHLCYDPLLHGYDDSLVECLFYLDRLHWLKSLKLKIMTSRWPIRDTKMNEKLAFPNSLNKLSLSHCQLHWDDLSKIGLLPQLQVLNLNIHAVTAGKKWSPVIGQFLNLQVLKIDKCHLSCWEADSSHFPKLEKLLLSWLHDLKEIPLDIGEIPTLKLIHLDICKKSAAISVMRIKEQQLENYGIDDLQIQVNVFSSEHESFKKKVEKEGLNINDIQLQIHW